MAKITRNDSYDNIPNKVKAINFMGAIMAEYCEDKENCKSMELVECRGEVYNAVKHSKKIEGMEIIVEHCVTVKFNPVNDITYGNYC